MKKTDYNIYYLFKDKKEITVLSHPSDNKKEAESLKKLLCLKEGFLCFLNKEQVDSIHSNC